MITSSTLSQLRIFKYPNIKYVEDPRDSTNTNLIANVFLTPREKYNVAFNFDVSQSNIQDFGIGFGGSLLIRNIFRGAETFEISTRGSIGSSSDAADSETVQQIKQLLDTRVRPAVAMDGGDIVFQGFDDGIVTLQMRGACQGCPSSTATLKMGIENMLRHYIPEVREVRAAEL